MKMTWMAMAVAAWLLVSTPPGSDAQVGNPTDRLTVPPVSGWVAVVVWDETAKQYIYNQAFFQPTVVEYTSTLNNRWYWIGVWDYNTSQYVKSAWFVHFR